MSNMAFDGVVFDMDGLLLDTEPLYEEAIAATLAKYGGSYGRELNAQIIGRDEITGAKMCLDANSITAITPEQFLEQRDALLHEMFPTAPPMPGARDLVAWAHRVFPGRVAVATSSTKEHAQLKTSRQSDWLGMSTFAAFVCGDDPDLANGKPAPDIYLLAAKRIGVDPTRAIAFEDSPSGCAAAAAAGMHTVAVPDLRYGIPDERYPKANTIIHHLDSWSPLSLSLPPVVDAAAPSDTVAAVPV